MSTRPSVRGPAGGEIVPPSVAQMTGVSSAQEAVAYVPREVFRAVPRAHRIILMERVKHLPTRFWYEPIKSAI